MKQTAGDYCITPKDTGHVLGFETFRPAAYSILNISSLVRILAVVNTD